MIYRKGEGKNNTKNRGKGEQIEDLSNCKQTLSILSFVSTVELSAKTLREKRKKPTERGKKHEETEHERMVKRKRTLFGKSRVVSSS